MAVYPALFSVIITIQVVKPIVGPLEGIVEGLMVFDIDFQFSEQIFGNADEACVLVGDLLFHGSQLTA